jgi:hypothetical protein
VDSEPAGRYCPRSWLKPDEVRPLRRSLFENSAKNQTWDDETTTMRTNKPGTILTWNWLIIASILALAWGDERNLSDSALLTTSVVSDSGGLGDALQPIVGEYNQSVDDIPMNLHSDNSSSNTS